MQYTNILIHTEIQIHIRTYTYVRRYTHQWIYKHYTNRYAHASRSGLKDLSMQINHVPTLKLFINTYIYVYNRIKHSTLIYCLAGMFGRVDVWQIAKLKVIGEIKFGE